MSKYAFPDLIVIGAGIFGLWQARHALKRGERVLVLEKRQVGAGASGGFLGALMPHMPDSWNAKKQMQFDGLASLERAVAELETDTGFDCGYRRCGRLMPLRHERTLEHLQKRIEGANAHWVDAGGKQLFAMEHLDQTQLRARLAGPNGEDWLSPEIAERGAQYDTLSARINPRSYIRALGEYVRGHELGEIREDSAVATVGEAGEGACAVLEDGTRIECRQIVIANGWEAYRLLGSMKARYQGQVLTGRGVKGQAVLAELAHGDDLPIIYDDGTYVIAHGAAMGADETGRANRIAIGATSRNDWVDEKTGSENLEEGRTRFDPHDTGFLDQARMICPAIRQSPIVETWANIRPRNTLADPQTGKTGTDPVFGSVDGNAPIGIAVGGFKISFGIAHLDLL